jgi:phosphoribosylaminoimidazole-succinocarboxamide synthase
MKTAERALRDVVIPGRAPDYQGKVRDIYQIDSKLIVVASDRVSATT